MLIEGKGTLTTAMHVIFVALGTGTLIEFKGLETIGNLRCCYFFPLYILSDIFFFYPPFIRQEKRRIEKETEGPKIEGIEIGGMIERE